MSGVWGMRERWAWIHRSAASVVGGGVFGRLAGWAGAAAGGRGSEFVFGGVVAGLLVGWGVASPLLGAVVGLEGCPGFSRGRGGRVAG